MSEEEKKKLTSDIISNIVISIGISTLTDLIKSISTMNVSIIKVSEWDDSYEIVNKLIYKMNPERYMRFRTPTSDKSRYELTPGARYTIHIDKGNWMLVEADKSDNKSLFFERTISIRFYGNKKHRNRQAFLQNTLRYKENNQIPISYIGNFELEYGIIPRSFDDIALKESVKNNIIRGILNWKDSKDWYQKHHLVHKIGVLLYGDPGTGKSTVAKAISTMLGNALILTMSPNDIMSSIRSIVQTRKRHSGILIVLIEDIDMFFPKDGENEENPSSTKENNNRTGQSNQSNQNAMFQLLDGVYSTDNTIYIATTNCIDSLDEALVRYGRFDIQERLDYFDEEDAAEFIKLFGYDKSFLDGMNLEYPVQPSYLQSKIMELRSKMSRREVDEFDKTIAGNYI